jgi:hypothetical protein
MLDWLRRKWALYWLLYDTKLEGPIILAGDRIVKAWRARMEAGE